MRKYFIFLSPIIFLTLTALLFIFKTVPAGKLWNNYSVLYVQKDVPDSIIKNAFESADIKDEISLSNQYLPVNISENSVEFAMLKLNSNKNDYLNKRMNYFFDKSENFRLYYVSNNYSKNLQDVIHILSQNKIDCGIDTKQTFSVFLFFCFLFAATLLTFFSKNKTIFAGTALIQLLFIWCNPFYTTAMSSIILLLPLFFVSNIWHRKNFLKTVTNNVWCILIFLVSVLCNFSISIKIGFLFFVSLILIVLYLYDFYFIEDYFVKKSFFVPVYIKSAKQINIFTKKTKIVMNSLIFITLILIIFFLLSNKTVKTHNSWGKLFLPSNVSNSFYEKSENLPQPEDYYNWVWNVKTFPYKSLNKSNNETYVEYPKYVEENGKITENKIIFSYNQTFKDNVFDSIDNLQFNAIEKVLKSEGKDFQAGYVSNADLNTNLFSVIMMFFCLFVLLFIYFSVMITELRKLKR